MTRCADDEAVAAGGMVSSSRGMDDSKVSNGALLPEPKISGEGEGTVRRLWPVRPPPKAFWKCMLLLGDVAGGGGFRGGAVNMISSKIAPSPGNVHTTDIGLPESALAYGVRPVTFIVSSGGDPTVTWWR